VTVTVACAVSCGAARKPSGHPPPGGLGPGTHPVAVAVLVNVPAVVKVWLHLNVQVTPG
jgi:hypothetical protein